MKPQRRSRCPRRETLGYSTILSCTLASRSRTSNQLLMVPVSPLATPSLATSLQMPLLLFVETVPLPHISLSTTSPPGVSLIACDLPRFLCPVLCSANSSSCSPGGFYQQQHLRLVPAHGSRGHGRDFDGVIAVPFSSNVDLLH